MYSKPTPTPRGSFVSKGACTLEVRGQLAESALSLHCVGSRGSTSVITRRGHAVCFGFLKIFFVAGDSQTWVQAELFYKLRFTYTDTHTDTYIDTQTYRYTQRHTDTHIHTHSHILTVIAQILPFHICLFNILTKFAYETYIL